MLFPCGNAAWLCWGDLELSRAAHRMVLSMLQLSWALSAEWHPVSDWMAPFSNQDKNVEIQEQTCPGMSMRDNWMSLLSSWNVGGLQGAAPTSMGTQLPCSLLLAVIHQWGTLGQEDNFRSLMKTGDWGWEVTDEVYQSTLSSCSLGMEGFCPNNVVLSVQGHPEKQRLWVFYGLKQGYCGKDLLSFDISAVSCSNSISGQLRFQSFLNTFHQDAFGILLEISWQFH